ncbi:hypothetical protein [Mesorhizobium sp.]|uniref:hypothetical protein n=1 Tax=Mesorhizobium sp. TaxID=1871066 RepID=UPI0025E334CF|nr:hypothetical protein [Mesorhizobium sp.]
MPVRTKIEPIAKDISIVVNEMLTPAAQSRAVADFARGEIAQADDLNRRILGRLPPKTVTVDGRVGASLESVNPNGLIVAEWDIGNDVLAWIGQTLLDRSPRLSGDYRKGHTLFADGVEIALGEQIPNATEFVFINLVPYARRLEVGKTESGRDFLISVPNRIYQRTYKDAKARFGNIAKITFGYETQIGAYTLKNNQRARSWNAKQGKWHYLAKQRADRATGAAVTAPAIRVSFKDR